MGQIRRPRMGGSAGRGKEGIVSLVGDSSDPSAKAEVTFDLKGGKDQVTAHFPGWDPALPFPLRLTWNSGR